MLSLQLQGKSMNIYIYIYILLVSTKIHVWTWNCEKGYGDYYLAQINNCLIILMKNASALLVSKI